ncbi:nucleoside deaminase [Nocardia sp. NPDC127579]|uniref:nucleoside deaminase n=1 Tax=Nocardia sp. NPDC127579 TaxID=3345402 RepID=UPI003642CB78
MSDIDNLAVEPIVASELDHLRRCLELAADAVAAGDRPFGSVLADRAGTRLAEDRNREITTADPMRHPEIELARWAGRHLAPAQRAETTMYTSGEHCPMCATACALVGLGRIVYISSSAQLTTWLTNWHRALPPFRAVPIDSVAPRIETSGPIPELVDEIKALQQRTPWPEAD